MTENFTDFNFSLLTLCWGSYYGYQFKKLRYMCGLIKCSTQNEIRIDKKLKYTQLFFYPSYDPEKARVNQKGVSQEYSLPE